MLIIFTIKYKINIYYSSSVRFHFRNSVIRPDGNVLYSNIH